MQCKHEYYYSGINPAEFRGHSKRHVDVDTMSAVIFGVVLLQLSFHSFTFSRQLFIDIKQ